ncbi:MAG: hypothetical protein HY821_16400 [Acidobacteria bacterium]|nr:hypothetical protein [Acidobacteriota bacterium]
MRLPAALLLAALCASGQTGISEQLQPEGLKLEMVEHKGRKGVKLTELPGAAGENHLCFLKGEKIQNGTIELWIAGDPGPSASATARGFVGVAFRVQSPEKYEAFYLRPTNGRAPDQVRRNHSAQYISHPDYPWHRLRKEFPEKYESYVDLQPGEWTRVKIVVKGKTAQLFVHGAEQPTLIVNDLFLGETAGGIALWVGPGTIAHFADFKVTHQ